MGRFITSPYTNMIA